MRWQEGLVLGTLLAVACGESRTYGKVDPGQLTVQGEIDVSRVTTQLEQLDQWFEACYARILSKEPATEGTMRLRLVGQDDRITPDIVENGTGNQDLAACVRNAFGNLTATDERWDFTADWSLDFAIIPEE